MWPFVSLKTPSYPAANIFRVFSVPGEGVSKWQLVLKRKLIATLNANKKKAITKNEAPSAKVENVLGDGSDEDESESKTRSFTKKRPPNFSHSLLQSKKHK
ncbi:UvrABC system protein B [Striga asiatica]|uniref:UvrABC system protein B n=1 Tax=Striga asiatica TaxID=4170 RepID=A0A5A7PCK5_STRAF|nr:UvrABC system protein B [Striga asiatica]